MLSGKERKTESCKHETDILSHTQAHHLVWENFISHIFYNLNWQEKHFLLAPKNYVHL